MSGQSVVEPPVSNRQHQLLTEKSMRECAGSTAACAMVCCCCSPCVVMHFVVLAVYKLPTGLFRKAWRKNKKKRMMRKTTAKQIASSTEETEEKAISLSRTGKSPAATVEERGWCEFHEDGEEKKDGSRCGDAGDGFDSDMWDQFREGGFWRSPLDGDSED